MEHNTAQPDVVAPPDPAPRLYTRKDLVAELKKQGIPISLQTMHRQSMPSNDEEEGPPIACWWGSRPLYRLDEALDWVRSRLTKHRPPPAKRRAERADRPGSSDGEAA
jgi:hypothetical protein